MTESIITAIISSVSTGIIALLGALIANNRTQAVLSNEIAHLKEDIKRLETKQDKHNSIIERTYKLEEEVHIIKTRMEGK